MKKPNKKIIGGLMVAVLVVTIGAVFASADTNGTKQDLTPPDLNFIERPLMNKIRPFNSNSTEHGFFCYDLTEEQQTELDELITNLKDSCTNASEIKKVIDEKLDEFDVFDQRLENEIEQTEQRLQILNREKELREQGYTWDEISSIIQDEFGIDYPIQGDNHDMMGQHGFGRGLCRGSEGFIPGEEN